jgi:dolichol-phosphate mannosyltransferase
LPPLPWGLFLIIPSSGWVKSRLNTIRHFPFPCIIVLPTILQKIKFILDADLKITVVIPTYNERDNIEKLSSLILSQDERIHLLFVDDNSPDGTGDIADLLAAENPRVQVLHRAGKMGLGSAYREGFKIALDAGSDYIIEMDADFSHDPAMLPLFIEKMSNHDVVIGSRYANGVSVVNWPIRRLILSYCASVYTRLITGLHLSDCTGGFKCFKRGA